MIIIIIINLCLIQSANVSTDIQKEKDYFTYISHCHAQYLYRTIITVGLQT